MLDFFYLFSKLYRISRMEWGGSGGFFGGVIYFIGKINTGVAPGLGVHPILGGWFGWINPCYSIVSLLDSRESDPPS